MHKSERILIIRISKDNDDTGFWICNIYAPCGKKDKIAFFKKSSKLIVDLMNFGHEPMVCIGDFNSVLNNDLDVISGEYHDGNVVKEFNTFIEHVGLLDIWRVENPSTKSFTWRNNSMKSARRLDYIFGTENIMAQFKQVKITSIGFSDHRMI